MSGYSPTRTMAKPICGGILVAFHAYTHGMIHPRNEFKKKLTEVTNFVREGIDLSEFKSTVSFR